MMLGCAMHPSQTLHLSRTEHFTEKKKATVSIGGTLAKAPRETRLVQRVSVLGRLISWTCSATYDRLTSKYRSKPRLALAMLLQLLNTTPQSSTERNPEGHNSAHGGVQAGITDAAGCRRGIQSSACDRSRARCKMDRRCRAPQGLCNRERKYFYYVHRRSPGKVCLEILRRWDCVSHVVFNTTGYPSTECQVHSETRGRSKSWIVSKPTGPARNKRPSAPDRFSCPICLQGRQIICLSQCVSIVSAQVIGFADRLAWRAQAGQRVVQNSIQRRVLFPLLSSFPFHPAS